MQAAAEDDLDDSYFLGESDRGGEAGIRRCRTSDTRRHRRSAASHHHPPVLRNPTIGPLLDDLGVAMESRLTYESRTPPAMPLERIETNHRGRLWHRAATGRSRRESPRWMPDRMGKQRSPLRGSPAICLIRYKSFAPSSPRTPTSNRYFEIMNTRSTAGPGGHRQGETHGAPEGSRCRRRPRLLRLGLGRLRSNGDLCPDVARARRHRTREECSANAGTTSKQRHSMTWFR